jgi:hypothetical protein
MCCGRVVLSQQAEVPAGASVLHETGRYSRREYQIILSTVPVIIQECVKFEKDFAPFTPMILLN